jgi:hypothetical protein
MVEGVSICDEGRPVPAAARPPKPILGVEPVLEMDRRERDEARGGTEGMRS